MTFLKWAGGKSQLLPKLDELFPDLGKIKGYIEPFLGGGSVFFHLMKNDNLRSLDKKNIFLSDINPELINCYRTVRDNLDALFPLLEMHQKEHCEDYYYKIRDSYFSGSDIERAAKFIYLNKTCFNGIWRVNKNGMPNVPIGHKGPTNIYDKFSLKDSSELLLHANLNVISFEKILDFKNINDYFVYMDPPYYDVTIKGSFTGYTHDNFKEKRGGLNRIFRSLDILGCKVMLSNSDSPTIGMLFKGFNIETLDAKRMINSDGKNRGYVNEVVVMNYQTHKRQKTIDEAWI